MMGVDPCHVPRRRIVRAASRDGGGAMGAGVTTYLVLMVRSSGASPRWATLTDHLGQVLMAIGALR